MQAAKNLNRFLKLQEDTECMEKSLRQRGQWGQLKFEVLPSALQALL